MRVAPLILLALAMSGCTVVDTAVDIVKIPVKIVSAGVDAVTTSQSEADEKRGRKLRKEEARAGREARKRSKQTKHAATRIQDDDTRIDADLDR